MRDDSSGLPHYLFSHFSSKGECMNKGELIDAVAASAGLSRADATKAVDGVLDTISSTLAGGGSVSLVGFGTFQVKARAARMGRNPRTGEAIQIKASNVPGFKAGKGLKDAVN
jgi:DNA-binding protein HU-beta